MKTYKPNKLTEERKQKAITEILDKIGPSTTSRICGYLGNANYKDTKKALEQMAVNGKIEMIKAGRMSLWRVK